MLLGALWSVVVAEPPSRVGRAEEKALAFDSAFCILQKNSMSWLQSTRFFCVGAKFWHVSWGEMVQSPGAPQEVPDEDWYGHTS